MEFCYYPGCTLKTKAKELDRDARLAAAALGVTLTELADWQCCGAVYPLAKDEIATRLSSVRALEAARAQGKDLLTLCSACHHVIKRVNRDMADDPGIQSAANRYLDLALPYTGETRVVHYLEMLRDTVGFDSLKAKVVKPLEGKRVAAYYGCLLLRPSSVMQFDNPENPAIMEDFITAIGGKPVVYPYRNECCGGYISVGDPALAEKMCRNILSSAIAGGAEAIITACPLCKYNLEQHGGEKGIPVHYFTELLAQALGIGGEKEADARAS